MSRFRTRLVVAAATAGSLFTGFTASFQPGDRYAHAQSGFPFFGKKKAEEPLPPAANVHEKVVSLRFYSTLWGDVLKSVAADTGSTLVADQVPGGKFSRQDFRKYTRAEAVRVLNEELEAKDFRLLEKGDYLVLVNVASTRSDYPRPVVDPHHEVPVGVSDLTPPTETDLSGYSRHQAFQHGSTVQQPAPQSGARDQARSGSSQQAFGSNTAQTAFQRGQGAQAQFQPAGAVPRSIARPAAQEYQPQEPTQYRPLQAQQQQSQPAQSLYQPPQYQAPRSSSRPADMAGRQQRAGAIRQVGYYQEEASGSAAQELIRLTYKPSVREVKTLASTLRAAFGDRAKLIDSGPDGLPAMQVLSAVPNVETGERGVIFTLAVDVETGDMLVEGPREQAERVVRLLERLDAEQTRPNEATRVVTTDKGARAVAQNLQPAVDRMVAQNTEAGPAPRGEEDPAAVATEPQVGGDVLGGIRGNVSVEAIDELGVLVLRGNQRDVDAVMEIIRQIEELSARTAPDIHLRSLKHVDSQALSELLTTVYEQLNQARGRTSGQEPQIGIFAVGKPNAVLLLAPADDLESVLQLIDELDKPIAPQTSFAVFTLKHAIAAQIETMLEDFYDRQAGNNAGTSRPGLSARVKIVADSRTNSVVVLAQPNDLAEITKVISQLDRNESGAVSQVQIVNLKNAVAEELAETISAILQSVLNPPTLGQGQQQQAFLGLNGNSSQQLRDVRSAVLEFVNADGGSQQKLRSGILADIRITGDPRSNSLIVTSPAESMELVLSLIRHLDRPASSVATIKHFVMRNADASSVADLLTELFSNQTTAQGQQVGVQLAGAENASSVVPLRFSVDSRTNSIVAVGTAEALEVVEALLFRLDESDIHKRRVTIIRLKHAPTANVADAVTQFLSQQQELLSSQQSADGSFISPFELIEREVILQPEAYTNSLLISATDRYFDQVREMVLKLDQELPQVVIQVMLVEVMLEDIDEFGIELGVQDPILFDRGGSTTSTSNGVTTTTLNPGFAFNNATFPNTNASRAGKVAGQALSNFGVGRVSDAAGFGGLVLSASSEYLNVLLRALAAHRNIEVLSRPQIRTLDNRAAYIRMVREQPRVNGFTTGINGINSPTVEIAEAGIIMDVTPTISPDGTIQLGVHVEKSAFDNNAQAGVITDSNGNTVQTTVKDVTEAETTIVVADEQTIILGGLITKSTDKVERRIPWLSDIPVIGDAFGFDSLTQRRSELLIFLTPRIVKGDGYNEMLKQIETQRLHFTECDAEAIHGPLYGIPPESSGWDYQIKTPDATFGPNGGGIINPLMDQSLLTPGTLDELKRQEMGLTPPPVPGESPYSTSRVIPQAPLPADGASLQRQREYATEESDGSVQHASGIQQIGYQRTAPAAPAQPPADPRRRTGSFLRR